MRWIHKIYSFQIFLMGWINQWGDFKENKGQEISLPITRGGHSDQVNPNGFKLSTRSTRTEF